MVEYVCRFFIVRVISYKLIIPPIESFGIHGLLLSKFLGLSVKLDLTSSFKSETKLQQH